MTDPVRPISLNLSAPASPYQDGLNYIVIPRDLETDFATCKAKVKSHSGTGAWLSLLEETMNFPNVADLFLIEFREDHVYTHEVNVLSKRDAEILVSVPTKTEKEKSLLAPVTGRYDYRVEVSLPVRVKTDWIEDKDAPPKLARLVNISRGGMSILAPLTQEYSEGQEISIRVVGWDYPVRIETVVDRINILTAKGKQKVGLRFPEDMDLGQRELISSFILQVQRREALGRDLPTVDDEA